MRIVVMLIISTLFFALLTIIMLVIIMLIVIIPILVMLIIIVLIVIMPRVTSPLLEGITSEDNNLAMGTDAGGFEALKSREENHLDYVTRSLAEVELAGAACSAEPQSERSQCWAW
jgi:hypothetical protein